MIMVIFLDSDSIGDYDGRATAVSALLDAFPNGSALAVSGPVAMVEPVVFKQAHWPSASGYSESRT